MRATIALLALTFRCGISTGHDAAEQMQQAWTARDARVKAAQFVIEERTVRHKEGFAFEERAGAGARPKEDVRLECQHTCLFDGVKVKLCSNGVQWNGTAFRALKRITILDGIKKAEFEQGEETPPRGLVIHERDYFEAKMIPFLPITRTFRGTSRAMRSFLIDDLKASGMRLKIDGILCEQFIWKGAGGDRTEFYLAPERDWVIVRESHIVPGESHSQLDVAYQRDEICGWVPKSWEVRVTKMGNIPILVSRFTVTDYKLNGAPDPMEFDLSFPAGTFVNDVLDAQNPKRFTATEATPVQIAGVAGGVNRYLYFLLVIPACMCLFAIRRYRERRQSPAAR